MTQLQLPTRAFLRFHLLSYADFKIQTILECFYVYCSGSQFTHFCLFHSYKNQVDVKTMSILSHPEFYFFFAGIIFRLSRLSKKEVSKGLTLLSLFFGSQKAQKSYLLTVSYSFSLFMRRVGTVYTEALHK